MRAFVTGATGFLGRRVVRRLVERGDEVVALARESSNTEELERLQVRIVRGDLGDCDSFLSEAAACEVVYHVGACMNTKADWDEFYASNVEATKKLIDAAVAGGVRRFVHVSSLGIFEIDKDGVTIGEESDYDRQPMLRGFYTRSKIDGDRVACAAARLGRPVVVVRPGQIYGPDHPQAPVFLGRVSKWLRPNLLAVVGSPSYLTPVTYVENAADAVVLAGTAEGVDGEIFNVVDEPDLTQSAYFKEMAKARGKRLHVLYIPVGLFALPVRAVDLLFRVLKRRPWAVAYQLLRSGRSARYATNPARARLGWHPHVGLETGLAESLRR